MASKDGRARPPGSRTRSCACRTRTGRAGEAACAFVARLHEDWARTACPRWTLIWWCPCAHGLTTSPPYVLLVASLLAGGHHEGAGIREGMPKREPNGFVEVGGQVIVLVHAPVEEGGEEGNEGGQLSPGGHFKRVLLARTCYMRVKIITCYLSPSYMSRLTISEENITSHFFSKNRPRA